MWEWSGKLKLGKSSAFVKTALRRLPLTEAVLEAGFFLDAAASGQRYERWTGMALEREFGDLLAMETLRLRPPTVNDLAALLAHAMLRPLNGGERQRPHTIHLREQPQWQELLPHLHQFKIRGALHGDPKLLCEGCLTHRVYIIEANGPSYRLRQSKRRLQKGEARTDEDASPDSQETGSDDA